MAKIEIIADHDSDIIINGISLRSENVTSRQESAVLSDAMKPTPNLYDDISAKNQEIDDQEELISDDFTIQSEDTELEAAGVVWRPAKAIRKLVAQINEIAPGRNKASDGVIGDANHQNKSSDHNPWIKDGDMWVVTAVDITDDKVGGCSSQKIVDSLVASKDKRIKYIIWNRQIVSSTKNAWRWRPYRGANSHSKHCHISVVSSKSGYDDTSAWLVKV